MRERISAHDARARFAELTDRVKYAGEPIIVEKQGRPIRAEDLRRGVPGWVQSPRGRSS